MRSYILLILLLLSFRKVYAQEAIPAFPFLQNYLNIRDLALNKAETEMYFTLQSLNEELGAIAFSKQLNGFWSEPELAPFSGKYRDIEPFLSYNDLRLYFSSNRPKNEQDTLAGDYDIWFVERSSIKSTWGQAINIGPPINTPADEFFPSLGKSKNIYFTKTNGLNNDDIYCAKWDGKQYLEPEVLDSTINSALYEFNAFVASDERYLIFTVYGKKGDFGSGDLYVSLKDKQGKWQKAYNLGTEVNSKQMDYCPFVDEQNKLLYFTSKRSMLNQADYPTFDAYLKAINGYNNGQSRLYQISLPLNLHKRE